MFIQYPVPGKAAREAAREALVVARFADLVFVLGLKLKHRSSTLATHHLQTCLRNFNIAIGAWKRVCSD
jgi:NADH:ubiquinone oxidoreductase subunit 5 (subunit L)/multisubunit Na+/H+ antiporter MnhA subunit